MNERKAFFDLSGEFTENFENFTNDICQIYKIFMFSTLEWKKQEPLELIDSQVNELGNSNSEKLFKCFYQINPEHFSWYYKVWTEALEELRNSKTPEVSAEAKRLDKLFIDIISVLLDDDHFQKEDLDDNFIIENLVHLVHQYSEFISNWKPNFCVVANTGTLQVTLEDAFDKGAFYVITDCKESPIPAKFHKLWTFQNYKCYEQIDA